MKICYLFLLGLLCTSPLFGQSLLSEDFNNGLPATWTVVDGGDGTDTWFATTGGARGGNYLNGSEFMFVDSDASPQTDTLSELLVSPTVNTLAYTDLVLEFDHHMRVYSNEVGYLEVYNGSAWITMDSFPNGVGGFNNPVTQSYTLSAYGNANFQFRFRYEDNGVWGWYWGVDNVNLFSPQALDADMLSFDGPFSACGLGSEPVSISFRNNGADTIQNLNLAYTINAGTPVIETYSTPVPPGDTVNYTFNTLANLSTPGAYTFDVYTDLTNDANLLNDTLSGNQVNHFSLVNSFPYREDFEMGQGDWNSFGVNNSWAFGTPAKDVIIGAASGSNAWVTGGLGTTDYNNNEQSWIQSPCMDLSSLNNPWIQFSIWWNIEFSWDGAVLQSSTDLGGTWTTIGAFGDPTNWYTDNTINAAPGGSQDGWSGRNATNDGSGGWVTASHDLSAVAGQQDVIFRFIFGTDGSVTDDGVAIDDILIANGPAISLGPDTTACDSVVLDPGGPFEEYQWSTGDSSQTLTATSTGTYEVIVTDSNGFITRDEIALVVYTLNDLDLGADTSICDGSGLTLDAGSSGTTYLWNTGDNTSTLNVTTSGTYFVTVAYGVGCLQIDQIEVFLADLQPGYTLSDTPVCRNVPATFTDTTSSATGWLWDFGDGTTSTQQTVTHTYTSGGTFVLKLIVEAGDCRDSIVEFLPVLACGTGVEPGMASSLELYPNPNQGSFEVSWEGITGNAPHMRVLDLQGKVQWEKILSKTGNHSMTVDLPLLSEGLYFFEFTTTEGRWVKKMEVIR